MLTNEEIAVFVAEIRRDILYIKQMFDDKCRTYDAHVSDGQLVRDRLAIVEKVADRATKDIDNILWKLIISGVIVPVIVSLAVAVLLQGVK